ncbi:MAG: hypothetical protein WA821_03195 [Anaerolineales bacterium]
MRSPLTTALLNPLNVFMLVFSGLVGLIAAWWLFPIGLVIWAVMVAVIANDKSIRINYNMEARLGTLSPRFQDPYSKAVKAQMRIFNSLLSAAGDTRRTLEPVQNEVESLVDEIYAVCQKMTIPENYVQVAKTKAADLDGQRALLVLSIDKDMDPAVKKQKEDAVRALDDQIQKTKSVAGVLDRIQAELASVTTFMDGLLSDIMRLQVMGVDQMRQEVPKILQNIQGEITQLQAVEKEIAQLA